MSSRTGGAVATAPLDGDEDGWERYLDECAGGVGHSLTRFAMGLPLPTDTSTPFQDLLPVSWDERFTDDIEAALDDAEAVASEHDPRQPVPTRAAPPPCPTSGRPTRKSAVDTGAGWSASSPSLPTWVLRSACSSSG